MSHVNQQYVLSQEADNFLIQNGFYYQGVGVKCTEEHSIDLRLAVHASHRGVGCASLFIITSDIIFVKRVYQYDDYEDVEEIAKLRVTSRIKQSRKKMIALLDEMFSIAEMEESFGRKNLFEVISAPYTVSVLLDGYLKSQNYLHRGERGTLDRRYEAKVPVDKNKHVHIVVCNGRLEVSGVENGKFKPFKTRSVVLTTEIMNDLSKYNSLLSDTVNQVLL